MPPALSDSESESEPDAPLLPRAPWQAPIRVSSDVRRSAGKNKPSNGYTAVAQNADDDNDAEEDQDEENEDGDEDDEDDLDDDEFIVEAIKKHMIDEDGSLKFQVKWEGYESKKDLTWEPEENLQESAFEILDEYFDKIGGRDKIFQETQTAAKTKKRGRQPSAAAANVAAKRAKKNGTHPANSAAPAAAAKWSPPAGSWEDEIEKIDACELEGDGKLVVFLVWKNGRKTKHDTAVIYRKCPQKMLSFYEKHVRIVQGEDQGLVDSIEP